MNVLIVDDEKEIGTLLAKLLVREGYDANHVETFQEARKNIDDGYYQIYFLDINLPDGNGLDLIPYIKEVTENPDIVVISAFDGDHEINRSSAMGVDVFIKKPFTHDQIISAIRQLT